MLKKEPERTCIACREMKNKRDLIRIVKNKEGQVFLDQSGKANGRGCYVCNSSECFNKLKKQKLLNRAFKCSVDEEIYKNLEEVIIGKDSKLLKNS